MSMAFAQRTRRVLNVRWPDNPCGDAPTESARIICEQLRKWDEGARSRPPVPEIATFMPGLAGRPRMIAAELAPIASSPYQCMDLLCLCTYLREYRMLSEDERQRFHSALVQLKRSGEFDKLALIHAQFSISVQFLFTEREREKKKKKKKMFAHHKLDCLQTEQTNIPSIDQKVLVKIVTAKYS
uniref:Uncharacterized protein n=1 Tax=Parascaris equorum TaxID=6256 RepID=A0A914RCA3_PAREQ